MTDENITLKKLLHGYHSEASAMLRAGYLDCNDAINRFITYIEGEGVIRHFLNDCVENHVPESFDAASDVEEVTSKNGIVFGHFAPDFRGEAGEVYLILKAILNSGGISKGYLLVNYGKGSKKFDNMVKNFMSDVAIRLVYDIDRYLTELGIEKGLSDTSYYQMQQTVNTGDNSNVALGQSADNSATDVMQDNGINGEEPDKLLAKLEGTFEDLGEAQREDAEMYVDGLRDALSEPKPKQSIVKAIYACLRKISGGAQFIAALADIGAFLQQQGIVVQ